MTALIIDLPADVYTWLVASAEQQQKPVEALVREWVVERRNTPPEPTERERAIAALRAAGLLVEPTPATHAKPLSEQERAALAERLDVAGATPLSEIIIAEREGR